jgi:hypothetical protein
MPAIEHRRPMAVLYDFCVAGDTRVRAWRPEVPGVVEVFHAHMISHVYPMHTHEAWTLLIVDDGMVRYDLHRHEHGVLDQVVTLLPPQVPHNGRAATSAGFGKRVVYPGLSHVPASLIGQAVDQPLLPDPLLRQRIHQLHRVLEQPGEEFEAENRLAFMGYGQDKPERGSRRPDRRSRTSTFVTAEGSGHRRSWLFSAAVDQAFRAERSGFSEVGAGGWLQRTSLL